MWRPGDPESDLTDPTAKPCSGAVPPWEPQRLAVLELLGTWANGGNRPRALSSGAALWDPSAGPVCGTLGAKG